MIKYFFLIVLLNSAYFLSGQELPDDVGIDEKLDEFVDLDLKFTDHKGETKSLSEFIGEKPTVISIVYYRCPGICNTLLAGMRDVIERSDLEPGTDYNALSISMAHNETWDLARDKKINYLEGMERRIQEGAWDWVVGDSLAVNEFTKSVGFKFKRQEFEEGVIDYLHQGALIFVSPKGKITRYLMGTDFLPFDFKMAVVESAKGNSMPTVNRILSICFKYDPEGRGYVLNFTRIFGGIFTLMLIVFISWLVFSKKPVRR